MVEYATLNEIEETLLQYSEDLLGTDIDDISTKLSKPIHTIQDLDKMLSKVDSPFELEVVPQLWKYLINLYLPEDENADAWLNDNEDFGGTSSRQKLSVLDKSKLEKSVSEIAEIFYEIFAHPTVPSLPSINQLYYVTRLAQVEQIKT